MRETIQLIFRFEITSKPGSDVGGAKPQKLVVGVRPLCATFQK